MMLETMKELFGVTHVGEEEVPNTKRMRVGEEEVSLSQSITTAVPPKEEEVPVSQSPAIVVPPEEEETLLSQSMTRAPMLKAMYRPW
jgi:hypothetical protein